MTSSEYRWAIAAVMLSVLAIVLAKTDVEPARAAALALDAGKPQQSPVRDSKEEQAAAQAAPDAGVVDATRGYSIAAEKFVDEDTEERERARRVARLKMYADPPARALLLAEAREALRAQHAGLPQLLGLAPDEEERLMETLAESQLRYDERHGGSNQFAWEDFSTNQQMLDAELRAQLGDRKFEALQRYRQTIQEREEVWSFRDRLEPEHMLSAQASERLIEALAEEGARMRAEKHRNPPEETAATIWLPTRGGGVVIVPKPGPSARADAREQIEAQYRRKQQAVEPLLDSAQRRAYADFLNDHIEMLLTYVDAGALQLDAEEQAGD